MAITITKKVKLGDLNLDEDTMKSAMELLKAGKPVKIEQTSSKWGIATDEEIANGEPVKLREATKLYQPVKGTAKRYHLVGASDDIRVAIKWIPGQNNLSIRVEGPGLDAKKKELVALGLDDKNGEYLSLHLTMPDALLARKTVGSILMAIGGIETPLPDIGRVAQ